MKEKSGVTRDWAHGKKVLMVLERDFPPDIRVENEIRILHSLGLEVTLASLTFTDRPAYEEYPGYQVLRKPISKLLYRSSIASLRLPFYLQYWDRYLDGILSNGGYDIIHLHDLLLARIGLKMKDKYQLPIIVDLHENWPDHLQSLPVAKTLQGRILVPYKQWLRYEEKSLLRADRIVTVVQEMKERIMQYGLIEDRIFVFSNVFNPETLYIGDPSPDPERITLYYAGGINHHRGLHIVARGLNDLIREMPHVRLWVAGKGKYESRLKKLVSELGLTRHIKFLGQLTQEKTVELLSQVDIALIPHLRSVQTDNSSPNKLFQYMYAARPLLVSDCVSIKRIVEGERCGLVYRNDSPEDFYKVLRKLIERKAEWPELGANGKRAVIEKYNLQSEASQLIKLYESLMAGK